MSSSSGRDEAFRKRLLPKAPASLDLRSPESNVETEIPASISSNESPPLSTSPFPNFSLLIAEMKLRTRRNLRVAPRKGGKKISTLGASSTRSTKAQDTLPSDTPKPDDPAWRVEFQPRVARTIARFGIANADFNPTIAELILELEREPKQFPKKTGKLSAMRAASLRYHTTAWRLVFVLDERQKLVIVIAFDRHDEAYRDAARRV
ncbi:MAG TPA: hypothetical protein VME66_13920 [Candidatus Acidoferrales bacterium]|nr:hypothetical protein [Candidatus Acidoferrales bacterium]